MLSEQKWLSGKWQVDKYQRAFRDSRHYALASLRPAVQQNGRASAMSALRLGYPRSKPACRTSESLRCGRSRIDWRSILNSPSVAVPDGRTQVFAGRRCALLARLRIPSRRDAESKLRASLLVIAIWLPALPPNSWASYSARATCGCFRLNCTGTSSVVLRRSGECSGRWPWPSGASIPNEVPTCHFSLATSNTDSFTRAAAPRPSKQHQQQLKKELVSEEVGTWEVVSADRS